MLDAAPKLQAILHAAGSVKAIVDPAAFGPRHPGVVGGHRERLPVAEFTVAAIVLAGKRAFRLAAQYRTERRKADPHGMPGNYGTTVGLLGASRIGRMVAERLRAFDLDVLISDPYLTAAEAAALGAELVDIDRCSPERHPQRARAADPRDGRPGRRPAARPAAGRRGPDQHRARQDHRCRGAAAECLSGRIDAVLDVTDPEPLPPDSPLLDLPNVFVTPHVAGAVGNEIARLGELAVSELERFAAGQPLQHAITHAELGRLA